jgi:hypothetical protein
MKLERKPLSKPLRKFTKEELSSSFESVGPRLLDDAAI